MFFLTNRILLRNKLTKYKKLRTLFEDNDRNGAEGWETTITVLLFQCISRFY